MQQHPGKEKGAQAAHAPGTSTGKRLIGEMLVEAGLVTADELSKALASQKAAGAKVVQTLISMGVLDADAFALFLARQPGIASIDLSNYEIPAELIRLIPKEMAVKHELFPIDRLGHLLTVGMVCPLDRKTVSQIEELTGLRVKPLLCSPGDIRNAINRYYPETAEQVAPASQESKSSLESLAGPIKLTAVASLIREIHSLPTLPETVQEVREAVEKHDTSIRDVAQVIAKDPPLTAKVLSLVNSSAFGLPKRVDTIGLAVSLLGLREIYNMVLSASIIDTLNGSRRFDYRHFWREAGQCAAAASLIGKASSKGLVGGCFAAGLLHDIGRLALVEVLPDRYARIDPAITGDDLIVTELAIIGVSHAEAGHELAVHWNLPESIATAIRFHHQPELAQNYKELVAVVALADLLSREDATEAVIDAAQSKLEPLDLTKDQAIGLMRLVHARASEPFSGAEE
jgi:HD-like signal output (HDOD) protein